MPFTTKDFEEMGKAMLASAKAREAEHLAKQAAWRKAEESWHTAAITADTEFEKMSAYAHADECAAQARQFGPIPK